MGSTRIAGMLLVFIQALGASVTSAQSAAPRICAFFQDLADVPSKTRERAKQQAALVFERSTLNLFWTNDGNPFSADCVVVRMTTNPAQGRDRDTTILGAVWINKGVRARVARIYYSRIRTASLILGLDDAVLLGHVIAHEVGHLLLPGEPHSLSGVMREEWDRAQVDNANAGLLKFNPRQASTIERQLAPSALR